MSRRCTEPCKYQAACGLWVLFPGGSPPAPCGASCSQRGAGRDSGVLGTRELGGRWGLVPQAVGWAGRGKGGVCAARGALGLRRDWQRAPGCTGELLLVPTGRISPGCPAPARAWGASSSLLARADRNLGSQAQLALCARSSH